MNDLTYVRIEMLMYIFLQAVFYITFLVLVLRYNRDAVQGNQSAAIWTILIVITYVFMMGRLDFALHRPVPTLLSLNQGWWEPAHAKFKDGWVLNIFELGVSLPFLVAFFRSWWRISKYKRWSTGRRLFFMMLTITLLLWAINMIPIGISRSGQS